MEITLQAKPCFSNSFALSKQRETSLPLAKSVNLASLLSLSKYAPFFTSPKTGSFKALSFWREVQKHLEYLHLKLFAKL